LAYADTINIFRPEYGFAAARLSLIANALMVIRYRSQRARGLRRMLLISPISLIFLITGAKYAVNHKLYRRKYSGFGRMSCNCPQVNFTPRKPFSRKKKCHLP
jgi:hypothetical protein